MQFARSHQNTRKCSLSSILNSPTAVDSTQTVFGASKSFAVPFFDYNKKKLTKIQQILDSEQSPENHRSNHRVRQSTEQCRHLLPVEIQGAAV